MKRQLRIGLAGICALYWPRAIAEGVAARRDATLVSFATLGIGAPEIARHLGMGPRDFAREHNARPYIDLDEMLRTEQLDAVALCTRHTEHARWASRVAAHGKDLFIAKTFATTMADADRICAAERRYGARIAVGPSARFLPWFVAARQAVDEGRIGSPFSLHLSHHHGTIDAFDRKDFYRDPAEGGPELSLGWYVVDLVLHFLQRPVSRVAAVYGNFTSPDSPFMDCGRLSLELDGGALASCDMYFCNRFDYPPWEMEVVGDKGAVLVRQSAVEPSEADVTVITADGCRRVPLPRATPHWELFWIDEFLSDRPSSLPASYAREVTRICLAARESAHQGKTIDLLLRRSRPSATNGRVR